MATSVTEATMKRISYRRFLKKTVSEKDEREILDTARFAPSGGNTQPWHCYVLAGDAKDNLTKAIFNSTGRPPKPEYSVYPTKKAMQDLVNTIIKILPPVSDETCTGRLAKVLEELEVEV